MQRALYEPGPRLLRDERRAHDARGDFLTAPELHPIFGADARAPLDEMWRRLGRPDDFTLREFGAGSGALFLGR